MDTTQQFESVYIHFPFCEAKCHYCDFFSLPESHFPDKDRDRVYSAICQEIELFSPHLNRPLKTLFLGGGTPSLVPPKFLKQVMSLLPIVKTTEITMEANPSSITSERAAAWNLLGINRISMGVQALDNARLKWLGRVHSSEKVYAALDGLFAAKIPSVSIDYIVGVPHQTIQQISGELTQILDRYPNILHLSAYLLTLKNSNSRAHELPSDKEQLSHLQAVSQFLEGRGFEQYEISNFAKNNARAQHNENYWSGGSYLGIGPSAHSYWEAAKIRTKNWASLGKYCELIESRSNSVEWSETLSLAEQKTEYLMLRLRRKEGLSLREYQQLFQEDLLRLKGPLLSAWQKHGYCQLDEQNERLQLTRDGFFLSDQILAGII